MEIPYAELMKYHNNQEVLPIYSYPVYASEFTPLLSMIMPVTNILDVGCGNSKLYNQHLIANGHSGDYVGIDPDPTLQSTATHKVFKTVDEVVEKYPLRHFDMLLMMNVIEHMSVEEFYDTVKKLNGLIDANIAILTPNVKCFDYMFADPQHKTFYPHDFLYGVLKHLGFDNIQIYRGGGYHFLRELRFMQNQNERHLLEMNAFQEKVCTSMGLDWYGNILIIGERTDA